VIVRFAPDHASRHYLEYAVVTFTTVKRHQVVISSYYIEHSRVFKFYLFKIIFIHFQICLRGRGWDHNVLLKGVDDVDLAADSSFALFSRGVQGSTTKDGEEGEGTTTGKEKEKEKESKDSKDKDAAGNNTAAKTQQRRYVLLKTSLSALKVVHFEVCES
jgi:hypothetical protein